MGDVQALTGANVYAFLLVLVALAGIFILFANVVEAARKLKKPQDQKESGLISHQAECEKRFERDFERLDGHSKRIDKLEATSRVLCGGMHALLEHELHNGNADEMRTASAALFDHLNQK